MTLKTSELISLVGERGSNIRAMQEKTKALIHNINTRGSSKSGQVIISGKPEDVKIAKDLITDFISTKKTINMAERQLRILVGRGGHTIAQIKRKSGSEIEVEDGSVSLFGTEAVQAKALSLIKDLFERTGVPIPHGVEWTA